jgi:Domain of unknown function (DUF5666)
MKAITRSRLGAGLVAAIAALSIVAAGVPAALASHDHSSDRHDFRGKVVSTDRHPSTVKVHTRSGKTKQFRITKRTRFEHLSGFSALKSGLKVEVHAKHRNGGWVAAKIDLRTSHA